MTDPIYNPPASSGRGFGTRGYEQGGDDVSHLDAQYEPYGPLALRKLLSPSAGRDARSMIDKHRDWSLRQQQEQSRGQERGPCSQSDWEFRLIGYGSLGSVHYLPGTAHTVKCVAASNGFGANAQLLNDAFTHKRVESAFVQYMKRPTTNIALTGELGSAKEPALVVVPCTFGFVDRNDPDTWAPKGQLLPVTKQYNEDVLISERVPPIHFEIRYVLTARFCPSALVEFALNDNANQDCLIRLYLGKRRSGQVADQSFSLRNYPLYLDDMRAIGLDIGTYASAMGEALAIMHWQADCDAAGVEFVLGGTPSRLPTWVDPATRDPDQARELASTSMWLLDFDRCATLSTELFGVEQAVRGFFDNDPYYPKPFDGDIVDQRVWMAFQETYIAVSHRILGTSNLPDRFIDTVVQEILQRRETRTEHSGPFLGGQPRGRVS